MWLLRASAEGEENLRRGFHAAGVDVDNEERDRVRFSDPVGREEHVRRSALGDVHLDTPMHSGHTMAIETLWSGTPVTTVGLASSPSRMAAGVLHAAQGPSGRTMEDITGLGELVTLTRKEHEDLVVELARKTPKRKRAPHKKKVAMFNLKEWMSGLNPLTQRWKAGGRTLKRL